MQAKTQQQRSLTAPISRPRRKTNRKKSVPLSVILLGVLGILGIIGLLFIVSVQNQPKMKDDQGLSSSPTLRAKVDSIIEAAAPKKGNQADLDPNTETDGDGGDDEKTGLLVLATSLGPVNIVLRPDLSLESTRYLAELAENSCDRCNFYRAEKPGILQGVMAYPKAKNKVVKGSCPEEYKDAPGQKCPKHDPNCGCHGPTMVRGMVGWAGGGTGPDFFIDMYKRPAEFWGQQHTVFGQIEDEKSLELIDKIFELPVHKEGMTFLDEKIPFTVKVLE